MRGLGIGFGSAGDDVLVVGHEGDDPTSTWTWDGQQRSKPELDEQPPPLGIPLLAYDDARARVVLYRGVSTDGPTTWELAFGTPSGDASDGDGDIDDAAAGCGCSGSSGTDSGLIVALAVVLPVRLRLKRRGRRRSLPVTL